jgi:hypothetical protein
MSCSNLYLLKYYQFVWLQDRLLGETVNNNIKENIPLISFYLFHFDIQGNVITFNNRIIHICGLIKTDRRLALTGTYLSTRTMPKNRDVCRLDRHSGSHQQYRCRGELEK